MSKRKKNWCCESVTDRGRYRTVPARGCTAKNLQIYKNEKDIYKFTKYKNAKNMNMGMVRISLTH